MSRKEFGWLNIEGQPNIKAVIGQFMAGLCCVHDSIHVLNKFLLQLYHKVILQD